MRTRSRATDRSMDRTEAARVLGVAPDAPASEARAAFRSLIRARHPDRAGSAATVESSRLIEAYRVLQGPPEEPVERVAPSPPARTPVDARAEGDSLLVAADLPTVMARLVEAGYALGDITYLDRSAGLVEIMLTIDDERTGGTAACSLVASLQGRLDAIEVFCTVERLDGHPPPPIAPLVSALAGAMR